MLESNIFRIYPARSFGAFQIAPNRKHYEFIWYNPLINLGSLIHIR